MSGVWDHYYLQIQGNIIRFDEGWLHWINPGSSVAEPLSCIAFFTQTSRGDIAQITQIYTYDHWDLGTSRSYSHTMISPLGVWVKKSNSTQRVGCDPDHIRIYPGYIQCSRPLNWLQVSVIRCIDLRDLGHITPWVRLVENLRDLSYITVCE